jgi:hypothetical protein
LAGSPPVQPVVSPDDWATWTWIVAPREAGSFSLLVFITVLQGATDQVLLQNEPRTVPIEVHRDLGQRISEGAKSALGWADLVLGVLGVGGVAAVAALVAWLRRRRRGSRGTPEPRPPGRRRPAARSRPRRPG